MGKDTRSRKYQLTFNNPEKHGWNHDKIKSTINEGQGLTYWCMADEVGDEGTYHTCLYLHFENQVRFSTIKGRFPEAHIEACRGTAQENRAYILKEGPKHEKKAHTSVKGTFEEWGDCPIERPGKRNDIEDMVASIQAGKSNKELIEEDPRNAMRLPQIERTRQELCQDRYRLKNRDDLEVEYWWGGTGTGKTSSMFKEHSPGAVYRVTDYQHPWDGYQQQPVVCLDEFFSSLPITVMNNVLDVYPYMLPCRYSDKWACFLKVIIIANVHLEKQYPKIQEEFPELYAAFLRRIHKRIYFGARQLRAV